MDRHLIIAGQGRAGSTLFYSMLRHTLRGVHLPETEMSAAALLALPGDFCTKRPNDILDIDQIGAAAKGRKRIDLIVTLRDPRDILTSRHDRVPDDYFCSADACYTMFGVAAPKRNGPGLIEVHQAIIDVAQGPWFPQGVYFLKYEDLLADPDAVQRDLAAGFGLRFDAAFSATRPPVQSWEMQRAMGGDRPLEHSRKGRWRGPEHRDRILDQFTRFPQLLDILVALEYEPDAGWFDAFRAQPPMTGPLAEGAAPAAAWRGSGRQEKGES
ncbi:hypothetical protein [Pseudooceanicola sp.]|uniref:hypothetical protein n=1 Tax=Pseudooceanicola sp. TaxID=1914328 RepID=UPI002626441B|nr:hypothetical protein [Pseudooceanicola sp.]MDF1853928.1 hypothetical protein [Pseudooceanicola sp.]